MSLPGKYLMRIEADGRDVVQVERYVLIHLFLYVLFSFPRLFILSASLPLGLGGIGAACSS
jgi:hypothetical protein